MSGAVQRKKLVVVGSDSQSKTCLLVVFQGEKFPRNYVPTVFESYVADITVDGVKVELALWDTAGQDDYDRLRPLSYPDTSVLMVCYSIDKPSSLEDVTETVSGRPGQWLLAAARVPVRVCMMVHASTRSLLASRARQVALCCCWAQSRAHALELFGGPRPPL